jgi:hypothetical protein
MPAVRQQRFRDAGLQAVHDCRAMPPKPEPRILKPSTFAAPSRGASTPRCSGTAALRARQTLSPAVQRPVLALAQCNAGTISRWYRRTLNFRRFPPMIVVEARQWCGAYPAGSSHPVGCDRETERGT